MPVPLAAVPIAIGTAQTLVGMFTKKGKRPQYRIPGAAREGLAMARQNAGATVRPGNQQAVDSINRNAGTGLNFLRRNAGSSSQILAGVSGINSNTNQALGANNAQNDVFRFNAQRNLQNTLGNFAQYQEKAFYENELKPYQDRVATKNALIGAGIQNAVGGVIDMQSNKMEQGYLDYLMGKPGDTASSFSPFRRRRGGSVGGNAFGTMPPNGSPFVSPVF